MSIEWLNHYNGTKIVILGYGLEGQSTYHTLKAYCPDAILQIMDKNRDYVEGCFSEEVQKPYIYPEDSYLSLEDDVDWVFKSPGIPMMSLKGYIPTEKITSQSNAFIGAYRESVIGITGTKGKSTTASFLGDLLRRYGLRVETIGNMGKPAFNYVANEAEYFIYELSSHQLETVTVSPKYSVVLNLFEEHLDHYRSYDAYAEAKMNIARFQKSEDFFIYGNQTDEIDRRSQGYKGYRLPISDCCEEGIEDLGEQVTIIYDGHQAVISDHMLKGIKGHHNLLNMAVGILLAQILGYNFDDRGRAAVYEFSGLPHRLSYVGSVQGVDYYNDSIATIPQATIAAVNALTNVGTVLVGGMDRGIDYSLLKAFIEARTDINWIMMPDSGHTIEREIASRRNIVRVGGLEEAVRVAFEITAPGTSCLLSPAAASYGFFRNFEERGEAYERFVRTLMEK